MSLFLVNIYPESYIPAGAKKRILVVDDDAGIQELLTLALEGEGYSVTIARDGLEGIEHVEADIPDLVVLDLMMPRLDGYGFVKELTRRGLRDRVPVLVLTAASRTNERFQGVHAEGFIDKPFSLPELLEEIARLAA